MKRSSGILMHISSLPGKFGIGSVGREAYKFVDFLKAAGQKHWQILPLGQTGYGDSPYQCYSAFAGNPNFIDLDLLKKDGLLKLSDYENLNYGENIEKVDYLSVEQTRKEIFLKAYSNFKGKKSKEFETFKEENKSWLEDYSLYMAIKEHFNLVSWQEWDKDIRVRKPEAMVKYKNMLNDKIEYWNFIQFKFFEQWNKLKAYANENEVQIIGDMPIYVAEDSSDTWSNPRLFKMDENMRPISVAGCPPDAFSITGQLWGNPIYDWDAMDKDNYNWWILRVKESFKIYDVLRIDHFRGFESYWEIPYGDPTAEFGQWTKGPGNKLFKAIKDELGDLNIIAEDLGFMTQEVTDLINETGYPGMKILQFAFGGGDSEYLPHNCTRNSVIYTGTHDNETIRGWIEDEGSADALEYAKKYLMLSEEEGYNWGFIRGIWSSVSDLAIAPMQDLLDLGKEARFNIPSTLGGNWQWRATKSQLTVELAERILEITKTYGRM
ncbi:MAG: 4-alpha-glucanotransferase [Clostridium sp.]